MMCAGDFRHTAQFFGPRNLAQKIKGVYDVRFDLLALGSIEATLWYGKQPHFVGIDVRQLAALAVLEKLMRDFAQFAKLPLFHQRRLVRVPDELQIILNALQALFEILAQARDFAERVAAVAFQK